MSTAVGAQSAALLAVEMRVRVAVARQREVMVQAVNAALVPAVRDATVLVTGNALLSDPELHAALLAALTEAQQQVEDITRSGYIAAGVVAFTAAVAALHAVGHEVPATPPDPVTGTLAALTAALAAAFATARLAMQGGIREGFDGVQGRDPAAARMVATNIAVTRAARQVGARATATAVYGVYRGATDMELALWRDYAYRNPYVQIRKTWVVQSTEPCATCAALDGTEVGLDEYFPAGGLDDPPVFRDLHGPPRHPNCRCRLDFGI